MKTATGKTITDVTEQSTERFKRQEITEALKLKSREATDEEVRNWLKNLDRRTRVKLAGDRDGGSSPA